MSEWQETLHPRVKGRFVSKGTTSLGDPHLPGHQILDDEIDKDAVYQAGLLGFDLTQPPVRDLLAGCAGAMRPNDSTHFKPIGSDAFQIQVNRPGFSSMLTIRKSGDGTKLIARLESQKNDAEKSGHLGVEIFANQVRSLRRAGVDHLFLFAAGSATDDFFNGYYTWPRYGFEATLDEYQFARLPRTLRKQMDDMNSRSMQDLFSLGGGDAWKETGDDIHCSFDLNPRSRSSRALERYISTRRAEFVALFARGRYRRAGRDMSQWQPYLGKIGKRKNHPGYRHAKTGKVIWQEDWKEPGEESIVLDDPTPVISGPEPARSSIQEVLRSHPGAELHRWLFASEPYRRIQDSDRKVDAHCEQMRQVQLGSASMAQKIQMINALRDEVQRTKQERLRAQSDFRMLVHQSLSAKGRGYFLEPRPIGSHGEVAYETLVSTARASAFLSQVFVKLPGEPELSQPDVFYSHKIPNFRGAYLPNADTLLLPREGLATSTAIHEYLHHLEDVVPGVSEAVQAFYSYRQGDEPLRQINRHQDYRELDALAVGIQDNFDLVYGESAGIYAGRYYESQDADVVAKSLEIAARIYPGLSNKRPGQPTKPKTELLSMGVQRLYESPWDFANDPEYFGFLTGILDGSLRSLRTQITKRPT